jgi:DnaJ-domain-containing protein 1
MARVASAYEALGVEAGTAAEAVRRAYLREVARAHPDRVRAAALLNPRAFCC